MPFLLYALVALAVLLLAARTVRPIARRDAFVLALLPLVECGEALVRSRVLAPIDAPWRYEPLASLRASHGVEPGSSGGLFDLWTQVLPWMESVRFAWRQGEWPLWNPFVLGGAPLAGVYQPAPFHPLHLLALALPLPQAFTLVVAGQLLLGALGMFLLLRELALRPPAALAGAAIWSYGSFNLFWLGWPVVLAGAAGPLAIAGAVRAAGPPRAGSGRWGLLAAGTALLLLGGNPEVAALAAAATAAAFLFRVARRGARRRLARVRAFLLGAAVGTGLAAIQLLPFVDALTQTAEFEARARPRQRAEETAGAWLARGLEQLLPPRLQVADPASRPAFRVAYSSGWIGGLGLAAALAGVAAGRTRWRGFLLVLGAAGFVFAARVPGASDLWRALPPFGFVLPRYGAWLAALAGAALAAIGVDALGRRAGRRRFVVAGVTVALAGAAAALALGARLEADALAGARGRLAAAVVLPPLAAAAVVAGARGRRLAAAAVVALALAGSQLELGVLHRAFDGRFFFPEFPSLAAVERGPEPERVVAVGRTLQPNIATLWGLEDARGYDPMAFGRLVDTFPFWAAGPTRRSYYVWRLTPFLDYLNVRWAWVAKEPHPSSPWRCVACDGAAKLVRNEGALPRLFVPAEVVVGGTRAERLAELGRARRFDRRAWLERSGEPGPASPTVERNGRCRTELRRRGTGYELDSRCRRAAWAVSSIPAWHGWRVEGAREPVELAWANHAFLAIRLPAGESRLRLVYRPRAFEAGAAASGATLAGVGIAGALRRRRRAR